MPFFHDSDNKASRFYQRSHPDFPATEPDDRVNGMAVRAVHIAGVNPENSAPLGDDAEGQKKWKPLIYKGFRVVVTVGLEPTVTIRNRLLAALMLAISLCSLELHPPSSRTAGGGFRSPIDMNDVL